MVSAFLLLLLGELVRAIRDARETAETYCHLRGDSRR